MVVNVMKFLAAILLMAALLNLTGCAVGFETFRSDAVNVQEPLSNIDDVKLVYDADNTLLRLSLERVLIERFHMRDIMPLTTATEPDSSGRFVIKARRVELKEEPGLLKQIWGGSSLLFFAVVPFYWDEKSAIELSMSDQQQIIKTASYQVTKRTYSWLPLSLFGPDYLFFFNGPAKWEEQENQQDKIRMYEQIMTRFITDVSPQLRQRVSTAIQ
jgi:hypothetical protein